MSQFIEDYEYPDYDVHPVATIFPMLDDDELQKLADDISKNGLCEPIVVRGPVLLDGRNRLAACELAGVEPTFREWEGDEAEIVAWILSKNLHRRHLSASQRAAIADSLATIEHGTNQHTSTGKSAAPLTQGQAAKLLGVSERLVRDARKVRESGDEALIGAVKGGELSVSAAAASLRPAPVAVVVVVPPDLASRLPRVASILDQGFGGNSSLPKLRHACESAIGENLTEAEWQKLIALGTQRELWTHEGYIGANGLDGPVAARNYARRPVVMAAANPTDVLEGSSNGRIAAVSPVHADDERNVGSSPAPSPNEEAPFRSGSAEQVAPAPEPGLDAGDEGEVEGSPAPPPKVEKPAKPRPSAMPPDVLPIPEPISERADYDGDSWGTPAAIIEDARAVLGHIDLDPASNEQAQRTVRADVHHTKAQDGLTYAWNGRVWLNPPFSHPLCAQFTAKLVAEHDAGRVEAALLLVNNVTDTAWFQALLARFPVCLTKGRIAFMLGGQAVAQTRQGQAIFYLGSDVARFREVFGKRGVIVTAVSP